MLKSSDPFSILALSNLKFVLYWPVNTALCFSLFELQRAGYTDSELREAGFGEWNFQ